MKISIEFYGRLKADFSQLPIEIELPSDQPELRIERIYLDLCEKHDTTPNTHIIKPILNDTFAEWQDTVKDKDVVGFFPPASGG